MSIYNNKANYHPISQINGNLPYGSYLLPGTEYYSVEGKAPRLQFEHNSKITDTRYRYSQHHRIDPIHSLMKLKEETSLTRYYPHNEKAEQCRDRYIFVPKYLPREEPNELHHNGLHELKVMADDPRDYRLREISKLPEAFSHALPEADCNDEIYRIYEAKYPYDMMVLRDVDRYNPKPSETTFGANPSFVSSTTIGSR